ncbi:MAG: Usg family protein, partial [Rhodospirillaceae bacterium]|nr:Usg family protein [Rhodospirillaceae bacterium]
KDYRLTTAQILYHLPDYPSLLQEFVWQHLDLAPRYPVLMKFLDFWQSSLDGKLHSVRVASSQIITPGDIRHAKERLVLH